MSRVVNFIFVGRLVEEKGFDKVLAMCNDIQQDEELQHSMHLHIFGDGELKEELENSISQWSFVTYHGHQQKDIVKEIRTLCHRTLMPSVF